MSNKPTVVDVDLTVILQECHEAVLFDESRFRVVNAGRGWGKTSLILADMLIGCLSAYTDAHGRRLSPRLGYMAPDLKQAKDIFWERAVHFFHPITLRINKSEHRITLINGATIHLLGSNYPDSARGAYFTRFYLDEAAFAKSTEEILTKIVRPMLDRVRPYGEMLITSTPDGRNYFYDLCKRGIDKEEGWSYHCYPSVEGKFIDQTAVDAARRDLTLEAWRQEYFAEFINPSNQVYYKFDRTQHTKPIPFVDGLTIHWGWDFNIAPACHSVLAHHHNGRIYVFDEIAEGNTPANIDAFCSRYSPNQVVELKFYGDYNGSYSTTGTVDYIMMVETLHSRGYNVSMQDIRVYGGNPIVRSRVENVNRLLQNANGERRIFVDTQKCPKLTKDFEELRRLPTGDIDKRSDPTLSHASDSFGYMAYILEPPKMPNTEKPKTLLLPVD